MAAKTFKFDLAHSRVGFTVRHMMFAKVRGHFATWDGELVLDPENPSASRVMARIETASIDTGVADRDNHLRSGDFFDVEEFPAIEFVSTGFERAPGGYKVHGNLTIRGTTNPVTLDVEDNGSGVDPWGQTRIGLTATTKLDREAFGLTWNQALEAGGVLVGKEVGVELELQAIAQA